MSAKSVIKQIVPPIFIKAFRVVSPFKLKAVDFGKWWKAYSSSREIPSELKAMVDAYLLSPSYETSSKYWDFLNKKNIEQLVEAGYENFRQTVACNYFTVADSLEKGFYKNLTDNLSKLKIEIPVNQLTKRHEHFGVERSVFYNLSIVLLLDYLTRQDERSLDYLKQLEEPLVGNIPFIEYKGIRVSQDMLNSLIEFLRICKGYEIHRGATVLEIGAGFGRTSYCIMKLRPGIRYIVTDIPPALYVSQSFLSAAFPEKKVFKFRPFQSFAEVKEEFEKADLIFLMPHQLAMLPEKTADLFLAIDCLHEMRKEQVQRYFDLADKLAKRFYFKCWQDTYMPFENITLKESDYPVKAGWKKVFHQPCLIPNNFFEAMYDLG